MTRSERSVTGCRWFLAAAVLLASVAVQPPAAAQPTVFTDIAGDVFEADIEWMIDQGALTAADSLPAPNSGLFNPHDSIVPSDLSVWLGRLDDSTTDLSGGQGQIPSGTWLSRVQAAYVMAEYFDLLPHTDTDHPFTDMGTYSVADNQSVDALYDAEIAYGYGTTYDPGGDFSRGQAAAMLHRGFGITQTFPLEDCDVPWSNRQLVGGVCVEACPLSDGLIPYYDADGEVTNCNDIGVCPFDQYGFDPDQFRPEMNFGPLWQAGPDETPAIAAGESHTLSRTALRCSGIWRNARQSFDDHCADGESRNNLSAAGDCIRFSLRVEAVVLGIDDSREFRSDCANRTFSNAGTWLPDDAVCASSDGAWHTITRPGIWSTLCERSPSDPDCDTSMADMGDWTVALDVSNFAQVGADGIWVDTPVQVSVTDWGDVTELILTLTAASPGYDSRPVQVGWSPPVYWTYWSSTWRDVYLMASAPPAADAVTVTVPRRSGPAPSDDVIEVNVADLADNGVITTYLATPSGYVNGQYFYSSVPFDQRFVNILRSDLLANDACPVGVDCSHPHQWPVEIVGEDARGCRPEGNNMSLRGNVGSGVVEGP